MKIVLILIMIMSSSSIMMTLILHKKIKNKLSVRMYNVLYKFGVNIFIAVFGLSYSYFYTDTLFDCIRVFGLISIIFNISVLSPKYYKDKRYNWLAVCIVIFIIYGLHTLASKYILDEHFNYWMITIIVNLTAPNLEYPGKNSGKMFIAGLVCLAITAAISWYFKTELISKPIRTAINKAQTEGYDIIGSYHTYVRPRVRSRFEPIVVSIRGINDSYGISLSLILEYYEGNITEIIVE